MIEFSKAIFKNGLTLIHHQDNKTPYVLINILYKVGAKHESPDKTGFAHLFEHLMFGGTKLFDDFDIPLQEAGASNNAFTNNDVTNYYEWLPAQNAELAFCMEADRMINLKINKKSLDVQKSVVIEEFKEHYINKPYGDVWHIIREMVYEKHPYRWPTIGMSLDHIKQAQLEDVKAFYENFYTPDNAILVVAGNIDWDTCYSYTEKWFGSIDKKTNKTPAIPEEPIQKEQKRKVVYRDVPQNMLYIVYKMPGKGSPVFAAADLLSDILSMGESSILHKEFVEQRKLAYEVEVYLSSSVDIGLFVFEIKLKDDVNPEDVEVLLFESIQNSKALISPRILDKVKNKSLTSLYFSENELMSRGVGLAFSEMLGNAGDINKEEEKIMSVTKEQIEDFIDTYLSVEKSNVLHYLKNI